MAVYKSLEAQEQTQARVEDQSARQAASRSVDTQEQTQAWLLRINVLDKQPPGQLNVLYIYSRQKPRK